MCFQEKKHNEKQLLSHYQPASKTINYLVGVVNWAC
jgi:hypothetical protein